MINEVFDKENTPSPVDCHNPDEALNTVPVIVINDESAHTVISLFTVTTGTGEKVKIMLALVVGHVEVKSLDKVSVTLPAEVSEGEGVYVELISLMLLKLPVPPLQVTPVVFVKLPLKESTSLAQIV